MRTYTKRIMFLISSQHLIPHGGLGSFAKSFTEMCNKLNWKVDLVTDKMPTNDFAEAIKNLGANIIYSNTALQYTEHTGTFAFSDCINYERIVNFRKSIVKAFETNSYDMIVRSEEHTSELQSH